MIAHGLLAALSFGLSGYLNQQTGTLEISKLGGLMKRMPFIGTALIIAAMAGCGLPGFANFAGELLTLFGAWKTLSPFVVVAAWGALVVGAIYMLRAVRNILHGPMPPGLSVGSGREPLAQTAVRPADWQPSALRNRPSPADTKD